MAVEGAEGRGSYVKNGLLYTVTETVKCVWRVLMIYGLGRSVITNSVAASVYG